MPGVKRLRIFAGPNGSGKSSFIRELTDEPPVPAFKLGYYVNADDIESNLRNNRHLDFSIYGIHTDTATLQTYFKHSTFAPLKLEQPELWKKFEVSGNQLSIHDKQPINSYIAADLAEYIRQQLVKAGHSFSYETVMSDGNKIRFLQKAKKAGYRIYLYFFATEDPAININRVKIRVAQQGHSVKAEVIEKRYYKSLQNLKAAVQLSDRAYLFDNSLRTVLIAQITGGENVTLAENVRVPVWFEKYLAGK